MRCSCFSQLLDVVTAGATSLLRGGSGAFVQGYKVEFVPEDQGERDLDRYALWRGLRVLITLARHACIHVVKPHLAFPLPLTV